MSRHGQTVVQTDKTDTQRDGKTDGATDRRTGRWTHREMDRWGTKRGAKCDLYLILPGYTDVVKVRIAP
jgi:hypothetical protein